MEIEIKDITNDPDNIVPIVFFIPENFDGVPLMGNCKYTGLSNLIKIKCYEEYVELIPSRTPIVKRIECERLLILSDNPDGVAQGNRNPFVDHPEYIKKIFQEEE